MNLKELQEIINYKVKNLKGHKKAEDIPVLVTLAESSIGARASSNIKYVGMGIDWENGQFRMEPTLKLVREGSSLNDIKPAMREEFGGVKFWVCPRCVMKIAKNDSFCRHCGQRLK